MQTAGFSDYIPHPSFEFDGEDLPGIWVGKYITGHRTTTTPPITQGPPEIKAGATMTRTQTIAAQLVQSQGFAQANNISGTSILTRNRDWGAIAYLTHSRYGLNRHGVSANFSTVSGAGGDATSTTGNPYGVFDVAGGVWESVAAYVNNNSARINFMTQALTIPANARYVDVYIAGTPNSADTAANNYNLNANRAGNATFETSSPGRAWFGATAQFPFGGSPVFNRGGRPVFPQPDVSNWQFYFRGSSGQANSTGGSRVVVIP